jgi:predicted protein tyrosine phosphatase
MVVEIRIAGYLAASFLLERESKQWHALVLLDSGKEPTDFVQTHALSHLYLQFDDVEEPRAHQHPPTRAQIEQALAFSRGKVKLLVTCRAGQGRSAATAYLIGCQDRGAAEAIKLLDPARHRPNRLVIALGDALLDVPHVMDQFDEWRRRHAHFQLSDYYDQLEKEYEALQSQGASNRICDF